MPFGSTSTTVAAMRRVRLSLRRTDPSPPEEALLFRSTALSRLAPSVIPWLIRSGTPKRSGMASDSDPFRDREVLFWISALSSIRITTVRMSPRFMARRSPRREACPALQSDAPSLARPGGLTSGMPEAIIATRSVLSVWGVKSGALPIWFIRAQAAVVATSAIRNVMRSMEILTLSPGPIRPARLFRTAPSGSRCS